MTTDPCAAPEPAEPFAVPGFEVVELVGFGATGEVWLARDQASGEEAVSYTHLTLPTTPYV